LEQAVRSAEASSHRMAVQLGKLLSGIGYELSTIAGEIDRREATSETIEARKRRIVDNLDAAAQLGRELSEGIGQKLAQGTYEISQGLANDLKRLDVGWVTAKQRRVGKTASPRLAALADAAEQWHEHQSLLVHRAQLGLQIAAFQHRFSTLVMRTRSDVVLQIRDSVLGDGTALLQKMRAFATDVAAGQSPRFGFERELRARFDGQAAVDALVKDVGTCIEDLPESIATLSDEAIASLESGASADVEQVTVEVRRLVQFLIETEFLDLVGQELTGIPLQEQRAVGVAHDVTRLLAFTLGDLDAMGGWGNDAFRDQIVSVVKDGADRLERELSVLRGAVDAFGDGIDKQIEVLRVETDPYALTGRSDNLGQYIRSREGHKAVSRVRKLLRRAGTVARTTFVALLYRRSTGVLLARRLGRGDDGTGARPADHVTTLARGAQPKKGLLASLPFYYRQLFSGQSTISETFWVGRDTEIDRARAALKQHEHGGHGALFVVGETGAGKTSLCQVIVGKCLAKRRVVRIVPPAGGTTDPNALRRAVEAELKERGELDALLRQLPDGAVFVFDDLELWWERTEGGGAIIETFIELVENYGDRHVFIANINVHAWRFIGKLTRLGDVALSVIDCDPLPAETLKSIISLRHGSTGLQFELAGTREDDLAPWRQARLFTRYFDYSGGLVAVALRAWLSHIEKVDGNTLVMRWPKRPRVGVLDGLRIEMSSLLLQLVLHKQLTVARLARITGRTDVALEEDLGPLVRMGLVRRDARDVVHVDRFAAHWVADRLRAQGMVA
ncbi:MAG: ATP-binding protein, partial [Myxococcota bacterium]